ncbi:MAG TPA: hypothetical protein P5150_09300 [Candidatus Ratteibacteria bacterium]|nr:hypothetical protein [Candidatus Ratteibacteria bacterium]
MDTINELRKLYEDRSLRKEIEKRIKEITGIDLSAKYGNFCLKNPILVAPGQLTRTQTQIRQIREAGFGGCVLKSVAGEDKEGNCSMELYRTPPTYLKSIYENYDIDKKFPIIHWDGRGDTRNLDEYLYFAENVFKYEKDNEFLIISSIIAHFPLPDEEIKKDEWIYTTEKLYNVGARIFEIDFCPQLEKEEEKIEKENILRWYKNIPSIIKSVKKDISVFPKIMNLEFGIDFQIEMVKAAVEGKADGVVIANRIFKKEFGCAHGGKELKERNIQQIKEVKKLFPDVHISATGGIYTGKDILDYIQVGAENVQLLSFLMGKSSINFGIEGTKFEKVFYFLLFDSETGLLPLLKINVF